MTQHPAGAMLRDPKEPLHVVDTLATALRTQKFPSDAFLSIKLSSVRSATALFRRLAWSILRPPYSLRHR